MNKTFKAASGSEGKYFLFHQSTHYAALLLGSLMLIGFLFTGCKKHDISVPGHDTQPNNSTVLDTDEQFRERYEKRDKHDRHDWIGWQTSWELLHARVATAKYRHINKAIEDGYADISVVVPNMGHHYMKSAFVDATFDASKPEILVYNKKEDGSFQLVAVEYAVPIDLSPDKAPKGFTGNRDVWDRNTGFGLWLLHAWIWYYNPDGIFNPTNPLVHQH
jgi:hypothetical protein